MYDKFIININMKLLKGHKDGNIPQQHEKFSNNP